jgi:hypothetical protein
VSGALAFGLGTAALSAIVVGLVMAATYVEARRRTRDETSPTQASEPVGSFTCKGCGSGPWDIAWDPHERPVIGRKGARFGPCCSGAD